MKGKGADPPLLFPVLTKHHHPLIKTLNDCLTTTCANGQVCDTWQNAHEKVRIDNVVSVMYTRRRLKEGIEYYIDSHLNG
jgi:hypothetical protein